MIELKSILKVGKVPDFENKKFGKLQISSQKIAHLIGKRVFVTVLIED